MRWRIAPSQTVDISDVPFSLTRPAERWRIYTSPLNGRRIEDSAP